MIKETNNNKENPKEFVMEFLETFERKDFKSARSYVSDNFTYVGPTATFDAAEPYLKYLEHLDLPKAEIKKVVADGHDICVLEELNFGIPSTTMTVSIWFQFDGGKISSIRNVFDPRPWLQQRK